MQLGDQRFPHKYVRRVKKDGKWVYVYDETGKKSFSQVKSEAVKHRVVIAQGKPTDILVDPNGVIVHGPPQVVSKVMYLNKNRRKGYYAIARDIYGMSEPVYLYPETHLRRAVVKKAAKLEKASRKLSLIDTQASRMMSSSSPIDRQYGLAMWLNNNTMIRIGAHSDSASVDPKERQKIINKAREEQWSDREKEMAMQNIRVPTFGILTLRAGHVDLDRGKGTVSFNFRGKGGKMVSGQNFTYKLNPLQFTTMESLLHGKQKDSKVFDQINYKKIWRYYRQYGITPHISRTDYANRMMSQIVSDFQIKDGEGRRKAFSRLSSEIQRNISDKLAHTRDMTIRSYISSTTRQGLEELKKRMMSAFEESAGEEGNIEALARSLVWLEIGAGNVII